MRADPVALLAALTLTVPILAGCLIPLGGTGARAADFEVYEFRYPGDDVVVMDLAYGFAARIHNPEAETINVTVQGLDPVDAWGPVLADRGWVTDGPDDAWSVAPGASLLFLFQVTTAPKVEAPTGFTVAASTGTAQQTGLTEPRTFARNLTSAPGSVPVRPGDHVQTATVGLWVNGTSFYTNIAALNDDEAFPAGYDRAGFGGDPLPVYVYDADNAEQPNRSIDTCHFTTITGYNALLKTQAEDSTNVRFLLPEEAYTRPGAEQHALYGDPLVFMNTVVNHSGTTDETDALPEPRGSCFECYRYAPSELVDALPEDRPSCPPSDGTLDGVHHGADQRTD